ncbi:MAG TPA: transposase, partial [Polyangiaceae bacterium]|nr:transposase [Polyangiaceae bacterium]
MISRRCVQRQFLLRPDDRTNQCFLFCLALAAQRAGVRIVAFVAMSNHYHAIVHDPLGTLPVFMEHLHKLAARALNARWGRWENLWAAEQTCATHLVNPADV